MIFLGRVSQTYVLDLFDNPEKVSPHSFHFISAAQQGFNWCDYIRDYRGFG